MYYKTPTMRFPDLHPVITWVRDQCGPEDSGRWELEYAGGIGNVSVRWCFRDKQDLDRFLDTWDCRA